MPPEYWQKDAYMQEIINFARAEYEQYNYNNNISKVLSMQRQTVSGYNFKMYFSAQYGQIEIIVYDQPWSDTRQVTSIRQM